MPIDKQLISKLENLAMLKLSATEKEEVVKDLNEILTMINKLEEFDTDGVTPLVHLTKEQNVTREDIFEEHLTTEQGLKNAKSKNGPFIIVPKVIK